MKKSLIALSIACWAKLKNGFGVPPLSEIKITPSPVRVGYLKQHPSMRMGKSGVAAAKRAARKRKNRR
ncbi:hypothetical protein ACTHRC_07720 [Neisseria sp. P0001.S009]|jgi:hypothetical protein|uniref:Uncharacterized protein n=1 Tax=Neisseria subflava TaxID=28449 RepID=A0AAW6Y675_NEISU|nr:hypothetical protein [Neisseria subflava]MDK7241747.1 hypothetical protein [Neisseria subflava]DAS50643.1 MAG TPA: hypothetical protein [Caudoviricetes sp.]